jgi:oligopeptidase B
VRAPVSDPSRPNWQEFLPKRDRVTVEDVHAFRDYLAIQERDRGLNQIRIHHFPTGDVHYVEFPEPVYSADLGPNAEFDTKLLRFHYTSLVTPACVFDYDMQTRQRELKKQQEVLGGYDPSQYQSERVFAKAPDGTEVPISIVYKKGYPSKKGFERNGAAPLLLYGYGSYGISIDPTFSSDRLSLLDRGIVYVIAHIRGGGDLGKPWHEDGRMLVKKNTFTDFIAAAEHLIAEKYTSPDRLAIMGGSAGGLLMGAIANISPHDYRGIVAQVPFVDVVTTMLDDTIPLTTNEYDEWGNPADGTSYDYMLSYSPYDNVRAQAYPAMLVTTGLWDSQVQYYEPAKWVAKLRSLKTDRNPLLLHIDMEAGHGGKSGRFQRYRETAMEYAFIVDRLND